MKTPIMLIALALFAGHCAAEETPQEQATSITLGFASAEGHITVRCVDGRPIDVRLGDQPLPPSRQQFADGRLVICDAAGRPMAHLTLWPGGGAVRPLPPKRPYMGVYLDDVDEALASYLDLDPKTVCILSRVVEDGPADQAGLREHDIILEVNGQQPTSQDEVRATIREQAPGDELTLQVQRHGDGKLEVIIELGERQEPEVSTSTYDWEYTTTIETPAIKQALQDYYLRGARVTNSYAAALDLSVSPSLVIEDGNTTLLGGVPLLSDVPTLGSLFSDTLQPEPTTGLPQATGQDRLGRLEERLERLESLLQRLVDDK